MEIPPCVFEGLEIKNPEEITLRFASFNIEISQDGMNYKEKAINEEISFSFSEFKEHFPKLLYEVKPNLYCYYHNPEFQDKISSVTIKHATNANGFARYYKDNIFLISALDLEPCPPLEVIYY